ncbi:hypothetical protein L6R52_16040 [Myxococcota bacterium]|nr:hypothetical protein [Myxococcota bacterium]
MTIKKTHVLPTDLNRLLGWEQTHGRLADERASRSARSSLRSAEEVALEGHRDAAQARLAGDLVAIGVSSKALAGDLIPIASHGDASTKPLVELGPGASEAKLSDAAAARPRGAEDDAAPPASAKAEPERSGELLEAAAKLLRRTNGVCNELGERWAPELIANVHDERVKLLDEAAKSIERALAKGRELPKSRLV